VLHAFVLIDAEPSRIAALCAELAETEGITEVFSVAGGVADVIAIVRVRHHDDLVDVVTGKIAALPGIEDTTTLVAFQAYSRHDLEAIWDLGPT
jgi:DNA-binding Lrp family transcriptional regulator